MFWLVSLVGFFVAILVSFLCLFLCLFCFPEFIYLCRVTFTKHKALSLEVYSWWLPEKENIQVALAPESPINFSSHVTGLVCDTYFQHLFIFLFIWAFATSSLLQVKLLLTLFSERPGWVWYCSLLHILNMTLFLYRTVMIFRDLLMESD